MYNTHIPAISQNQFARGARRWTTLLFLLSKTNRVIKEERGQDDRQNSASKNTLRPSLTTSPEPRRDCAETTAEAFDAVGGIPRHIDFATGAANLPRIQEQDRVSALLDDAAQYRLILPIKVETVVHCTVATQTTGTSRNQSCLQRMQRWITSLWSRVSSSATYDTTAH